MTEYTHTYTLTAGEADAHGTMPLTLMLERAIEVATEHANELGIGSADLSRHGIAWVLSRISLEMQSMPGINQTYSLTTWVESYNRHFSNRNFAVTDGEGRVIGLIRSVWVAIDVASRTLGDLSLLADAEIPLSERPCAIAPAPKMRGVGEGASESGYTFRYCDIDFNRHVNSVRYLVMVLNHWTLDHFDNNEIARLDIAYNHECYFGEHVKLRVLTVDNSAGSTSDCEIVRDGSRAVCMRLQWRPRHPDAQAR